MFEHWMKLPEETAFDFSSLRGVVLGGSVVSAKDKRRYAQFLKKHGAADVLLFNGYGISELGGACCISGNGRGHRHGPAERPRLSLPDAGLQPLADEFLDLSLIHI